MLAVFKSKKIIISFFSWLFSIFLFDLIIFLKKDSESLTSIETIFLLLTIVGGVISFIIFILSLEKLYHEKYPKIKASIFSSLSFIIFVIFGIGLIITPLVFFNKNKEIVKPTEASKNILISSPLKLGSSGEDVKLLQAVLSTDKSIYPSGIISGYYGDLTKQAVINFQQKYSLPQNGELDQQTLDKFNEVYGDKDKNYYLNLIPKYTPNNYSNNNQPNYDYSQSNEDPIIDCTIGTKCGPMKIRKSECLSYSYCCEVGGNYIPVKTLDECIRSQNAFSEKNQSNNKIPIVMPHNGLTFYCDPSIKDQIINASNLLIESERKLRECLRKNDELLSMCVYNCSNNEECLNKCRNDLSFSNKLCYDTASNYSNSWRSLLDRYCR
jgi:peptidoglycan hydrolase-like protein with peptidoglycan-binding domain